MLASAWTTQAGYARDLVAFLSFLHRARGGRSWRDATEADHVAYLLWRRRDEHGPRVADRTWDREVAAVNRFYVWQLRASAVRANPIPQRGHCSVRQTAGWSSRRVGNCRPPTATGLCGRRWSGCPRDKTHVQLREEPSKWCRSKEPQQS